MYKGTNASLLDFALCCPVIIPWGSMSQRAESSFLHRPGAPWTPRAVSASPGVCQGHRFSLHVYFHIEAFSWFESLLPSLADFFCSVHGLMLHMLFLCFFAGAFFQRRESWAKQGKRWKDRTFLSLNMMDTSLWGTEENVLRSMIWGKRLGGIFPLTKRSQLGVQGFRSTSDSFSVSMWNWGFLT